MFKKRKVGYCDRMWRSCTGYDMFGERIQLNLDGKESFDTCLGSLCTLLVLCIKIVKAPSDLDAEVGIGPSLAAQLVASRPHAQQ